MEVVLWGEKTPLACSKGCLVPAWYFRMLDEMISAICFVNALFLNLPASRRHCYIAISHCVKQNQVTMIFTSLMSGALDLVARLAMSKKNLRDHWH